MRDDEREFEFESKRRILEQIEYVIVRRVAAIWTPRYYFIVVIFL